MVKKVDYMSHKCEGCGHTQEEAGTCPTCNVELKPAESSSEESSSEQPAPEEASAE